MSVFWGFLAYQNGQFELDYDWDGMDDSWGGFHMKGTYELTDENNALLKENTLSLLKAIPNDIRIKKILA